MSLQFRPPQLQTPQLLTPALPPERGQSTFADIRADIRLVATDMDGTLTVGGEFTPMLLQSIEALKARGIDVLLVTGRSAGWVSGLVNYFPIVGAIAENGGLYIGKGQLEPIVLPEIPEIAHHRDRLANLFNRLKSRYRDLTPSCDNPYRITDWTFDIDGLTAEDMAWMQATCVEQSMGFTYSTVQCHLKMAHQNKAFALTKVLKQYFPDRAPTEVVTVGDSPNDESLFDRTLFPHSVGVANVAHYLPTLAHQPAYLTAASEGKGFAELVAQLLA